MHQQLVRGLVVCVLVLLLTAGARGGQKNLEERILPLVRAHKGIVAVAVREMANGECYYFNPDQPLPTASLIKFPVMIEVYQQVLEGKLKLDDMLTLREADKVPGSGILTYHFSDGATFCVRDAVRLMIAFSDNTATNMLLDKIGIPSTNRRMLGWGFPNTRLNAKVFRGATTTVDAERTKKFGLGSTTAREMVDLYEKVYRGQVVSPQACREMIEHLKKCEDKTKLKRFLPEDLPVAHKSGYVTEARTDAGILFLPTGPVAVCVLTAENEDRSWKTDNAANVLIGRVAEEAYHYFMSKHGKKAEKRP